MRKFIDIYPDETVRALSWKQPYAQLMLHGKVETRSWNTEYRGWVLICSSQKMYTADQIFNISGNHSYRAFSQIGGEIFCGRSRNYYLLKPDKAPLGKAIAIGYLKDVRPMASASRLTSTKYVELQTFVKYHPDLFLHYYERVCPIEPFDWKGSQGWKTLDEETKSKIILL